MLAGKPLVRLEKDDLQIYFSGNALISAMLWLCNDVAYKVESIT